jgi:hypothetical protein
MTTTEPANTLGNALVVVNEEPYLLWEWDLKKRNIDFLNGIDPEYFTFLMETFESAEDLKRASVAVRTTLHHSLETLFSLLGALLQSPSCVYGWLSRCPSPQLREVVRRIGANDTDLFRVWRVPAPSWDELARLVFRSYESGTEKQEKTAKLFAVLWARLAHEFLNEDYMDEYNSIKHGFRVRPGGFTLKMAPEREKGKPANEEDMQTLGSSEYGCTFLRVTRLGAEGSRSLRARSVSMNWHYEKDLLLAQLAAMSIQNVLTSLRIFNGVAPEKCRFERPENDSDFDRPWGLARGVFRSSFDFTINEASIPHVTRQHLVEDMARTMDKIKEGPPVDNKSG